jgi:transcriptional regulator with XRE-family HTH domain
MNDHRGGFGARLRACRQSAGLSQEEQNLSALVDSLA